MEINFPKGSVYQTWNPFPLHAKVSTGVIFMRHKREECVPFSGYISVSRGGKMENPYQNIKELIDKRKIKKAMRKLQAGLDVAPADLFFMEHLSICLQKKGRYEESIEICKKGLLIAPFCVPLQQELINSYTYSGQIELAKELLDKLDPEGVPPLWLALARGKYHLQAKNLQEAEAYLDRALREAPENAEAHYAKGILLFQQGEKGKPRKNSSRHTG